MNYSVSNFLIMKTSFSSAFLLCVLLVGFGSAASTGEDNSTSDSNDFSVGVRLKGGKRGDTTVYKYIVQIQILFWDNTIKKCTGTVLSPRTIITAGSCLNMTDDIENVEATVNGLKYSFSPEEILFPQEYASNCNYFKKEIAILRLSKNRNSFTGLSSEFPSLPNSEVNQQLMINTDAMVMGHGDMAGEGQQSQLAGFNYADVSILRNSRCTRIVNKYNSFYPFEIRNQILSDRSICSSGHGIGICNGDEGGALLYKRGGTTFIVGVHNGIFNTCNVQVTRVPLPMIHSKLYPLSDCISKIIEYADIYSATPICETKTYYRY